mmetsp:Transcript_57163/g.114675  ORF Transcript_57163/g.114675 Transcript_57163/m.114675 type:complete len:94 (+) Transcript_57163:912-1193(+)
MNNTCSTFLLSPRHRNATAWIWTSPTVTFFLEETVSFGDLLPSIAQPPPNHRTLLPTDSRLQLLPWAWADPSFTQRWNHTYQSIAYLWILCVA